MLVKTCTCVYPDRIGIWKVLVFAERGKPEYPHMTPRPGIEPGPHWWEASALTTAPSLLPQSQEVFDITSKVTLDPFPHAL